MERLPPIPDREARLRAALRRRLMGGCAALVMMTCGQFVELASADTISVAWENLVAGSPDPSAALVGADGTTPLPAGTDSAGDGAVVALGYFSGATDAASFTGEWIPLTGPQAGNLPFQGTTIGDTGLGPGGDGYFTFQTDFDSNDSATYQRVPAPGTRLSVAFYDGATIPGSTHFNIVTNDDWRWPESGMAGLPEFLIFTIASSGSQWLGGAGTEFRTALPTSSFPGGAARAPANLINISSRAFVGTGDAQLIPGFVLSGTGSRPVLVRAIGPTLEALGLPADGLLADPRVTVIQRTTGTIMAVNDDWHDQPDWQAVRDAFATTGAFPLPDPATDPTSDAALLATLPVWSGGYTVQVTGSDDIMTGLVLAEVYMLDDAPSNTAQLVNLSTRGFVGTGSDVMIVGIVVGPGGPRRLLVRGVGPSLTQFGLSGVLVDPRLAVVPAGGSVAIAQNDDWGDASQAAAIVAAQTEVGAFSIGAGSTDSALLLDLPAANQARGFTIVVSGANGGTGLVVTEIYELP